MKKFIQIIFLTLLASFVLAQDAPLTAPIARSSEVSKVVARVDLSRLPIYALVQVNVVDSVGNTTRYYNVDIPKTAGDDPAHPAASIATFLNGIMTSQAGETGAVPRRFDFRVLTYLKANGYLTDVTAVVP